MPHRIARATAYPYDVPERSFSYVGGRIAPFDAATARDSSRTPVIASGSNRSPEQLVRKFGHLGADATIPVERAWLTDFDVVYSAHITGYGSIPATLHPSPGTRVEVSVTWLDEEQLSIMHATESPGENYDYVGLERIALDLEASGGSLSSAFAYRSRRGALNHENGLVPMAETSADRRHHTPQTQQAVQRIVHARHGTNGPLETFILENIEDAAVRRARIGRLAADAHPFDWPHLRVIPT